MQEFYSANNVMLREMLWSRSICKAKQKTDQILRLRAG